MRYSPRIVSEHVPDLSTLHALVSSPRFAGLSGEDLAVALWDFVVDRDLGIFHYCPAQEPLWEEDLYDPLQVLNVYGFTICHVHANVLGAIYRAAGFDVRVANVTGHEGTEPHYDGRWHYLDCDLQMYHRLRPPRHGTIASREDLYQDPSLVDDQPNPSRPYHIPDRLPETIRHLYESPPIYLEVRDESVHSMDYRLRPGEEMVRYFHHRGRWVVFPNYPEMFTRFRAETGPEGPTERFWPRRQWGNGYFAYTPDLSSGSLDATLGADEMEGVCQDTEGVLCTGQHGRLEFPFESPYIYCGIPDPMRRLPSVDGAVITASFRLPEEAAARIEVAVEQSDDWETVWESGGRTGDVEARADFTAWAEGQYRLRLRFVLAGRDARLTAFQTRLWFMVSPHSLPALRSSGENRMQLHHGDRFGLNTRPILLQYRAGEPLAASKAHAVDNLDGELRPADPDRPWSITYRVQSPIGTALAWASIFAMFEGSLPEQGRDDLDRIEIADTADGPWQTAAEHRPPVHPEAPRRSLVACVRLSGTNRDAYVRFTGGRRPRGFRIAAHYLPKAAEPPNKCPIEIEHAWYEDDPRVGRRERVHIEQTEGLTHSYTVSCLHEPHNERVALRVPSRMRATGTEAY